LNPVILSNSWFGEETGFQDVQDSQEKAVDAIPVNLRSSLFLSILQDQQGSTVMNTGD